MMSNWKKFVPKEKMQKFKETFTEIVMKQIDGMLEEACFFGTHHSMYDCPYKNKEESCEELCWDDSDDRDIKEGAASFYKILWKDACDALNIQPNVKKRKLENEEAEREREEGNDQDNDQDNDEDNDENNDDNDEDNDEDNEGK